MLLTFNDTFVFLTLTSKDKVVVTTGWFLCRRRVQHFDSFFFEIRNGINFDSITFGGKCCCLCYLKWIETKKTVDPCAKPARNWPIPNYFHDQNPSSSSSYARCRFLLHTSLRLQYLCTVMTQLEDLVLHTGCFESAVVQSSAATPFHPIQSLVLSVILLLYARGRGALVLVSSLLTSFRVQPALLASAHSK